MTQLLKKDPKVDLRLKYRKVMEVSIIFALLIIIFTFYAFKKFEVGVKLPESVELARREAMVAMQAIMRAKK